MLIMVICFYMTSQTYTITKSIPIPKEARQDWQNKQVVIQVAGDTIVIKRIEPPTWGEMLPKLRRIGKQIPRKKLQDAIHWARKTA